MLHGSFHELIGVGSMWTTLIMWFLILCISPCSERRKWTSIFQIWECFSSLDCRFGGINFLACSSMPLPYAWFVVNCCSSPSLLHYIGSEYQLMHLVTFWVQLQLRMLLYQLHRCLNPIKTNIEAVDRVNLT